MSQPISGVTPSVLPASNANSEISPNKAQSDFATMLKNEIQGVNDTQVAANQKTEALATGQIDDLHDVMIAAQKASITLETSVQVQQKVIDAYNEIMRMQV
ncbi:flagellar hook-basal body complex protein FliE [Lentibacillus sp. N15]|uniref:flagellar hook-basal body complex protein FliE n=1 Tax=Lentibacillus songyuanensis TaxID=3136161 RepID=UPI0031BA24F9